MERYILYTVFCDGKLLAEIYFFRRFSRFFSIVASVLKTVAIQYFRWEYPIRSIWLPTDINNHQEKRKILTSRKGANGRFTQGSGQSFVSLTIEIDSLLYLSAVAEPRTSSDCAEWLSRFGNIFRYQHLFANSPKDSIIIFIPCFFVDFIVQDTPGTGDSLKWHEHRCVQAS